MQTWSACEPCRLRNAAPFGLRCPPPTSLYRRFQDGLIRPAIGVAKPELTEANKATRLRYCLGHVDSAFVLHMPVVHKSYIGFGNGMRNTN